MRLEAYFSRIGHWPGTVCSSEELHALTRAHSQSIPFENIDVLLQRPLALAPAALFDKLVVQRRGGYCFEQNGLFLWVLQTLGFDAQPLGARVRLQVASKENRQQIPPRTHLFIKVNVAGESWLTDVGFGSYSLTSALRWEAGLVQQTPHDQRRLLHEEGRWFQQIWRAGEWLDLYEFDGQPMEPIDQKVANWDTSTHPDSHFMQDLIVALACADGGRLSLQGKELRRRNMAGELQTSTLAAAELPGILAQEFGLHCPQAASLVRD